MIKKKIFTISASLLASFFASSSCATTSISSKESNDEIAKKWDSKITIVNSWINPGFKDDKNTNSIENQFIKLLKARFKSFKDSDPLTKNLPDVDFSFDVDYDKNSYFSKLENNDKNKDIYIANYTTYINNFWQNNQFNKEFDVKLIAQTSTLKFNWQTKDSLFYVDGHDSDPLRQQAQRNNVEWVQKTNVDYPDWHKSDKLTFDGSKYSNFYQPNQLTFVYRGVIFISGDKAKRDEITKDWNDRNWEKFVKHGIIFKDKSKSGSYKYQVALLARHFNKTIKEINEYFESGAKEIFKGTKAQDQIGKESNSFTPRIAFDDEGVYNWTKNKKDSNLFKTSKYQENKPYDDNNNDVVRVLIATNPAPYDVAIGRSGLSNKQVELLTKTLNSLSVEENLYGKYTGYNKFFALNLDNFEKFIKLQVQAETKLDLIKEIEEPKND